MKVEEVISFLREAEEHTYSLQDKYYLSKVRDTLWRMKDCDFFTHKE